MLPPNFLIPAGIVLKNVKTYVEKLFLPNIWPEAGNASYLMGPLIIKIYLAQHCKGKRNLFVTQIKRIMESSGIDTHPCEITASRNGPHGFPTIGSLCEFGKSHETSSSLMKHITKQIPIMITLKYISFKNPCIWKKSSNYCHIINRRRFILKSSNNQRWPQ